MLEDHHDPTSSLFVNNPCVCDGVEDLESSEPTNNEGNGEEASIFVGKISG